MVPTARMSSSGTSRRGIPGCLEETPEDHGVLHREPDRVDALPDSGGNGYRRRGQNVGGWKV